LKPISIPGHPIILLDEVASTNNYAISLSASGKVEEGTVVLTFRQTHGRGHGKNVWKSEDFRNLTFSLVLYPDFLPASRQFLLSQVISLGLLDFITQKTGDVVIKWPNDLLVNGKKIAGILIENTVSGNHLQSSVAGIGLNVNQRRFPGFIPPATSLAIAAGTEFKLDLTLQEVLREIMKWYEFLKKNETIVITEKYRENLFRFGEMSLFRKEGHIFKARIEGTDEFGQLLLKDERGETEAYPFKSVEMVF
jgi:BirA family transcriptional regulator, biotin operon repressor / biotin---[acetyl-CoA-carboxylase] ligase